MSAKQKAARKKKKDKEEVTRLSNFFNSKAFEKAEHERNNNEKTAARITTANDLERAKPCISSTFGECYFLFFFKQQEKKQQQQKTNQGNKDKLQSFVPPLFPLTTFVTFEARSSPLSYVCALKVTFDPFQIQLSQ